MPPALAARPRDARGYPVLAITPWNDGVPAFALTSMARILICAAERLCSICGTPLDPGSVYRVVADLEAQAIARALRNGVGYGNAAPTTEPGGHRACMLYAAVVCPYLARPNARRSLSGVVEGVELRRGEARGEIDGIGGALAGYADYHFDLNEQVLFRFGELLEYRAHRLGAAQLPELAAEVAAALKAATAGAERDDVPCPGYLGVDENAAEARASMILSQLRS